MASGREMTSSVLGSSDVVHDYSCTLCSQDGKNMEAVSFCVNCQTYFCESCVGFHNKLLKSHNLLDQEAMKTRNRPQTEPTTRTELLKGDCLDHPGNVIQMFCGEHDLVCCTVCIAVDHRACKSVDFIPKIAKGILKGQERNEIRASLQSVYKELLKLQTDKSKELSELNCAHEHILKEIQKLKELILERVDEIERKSISDVQAKYKDIVGQINNELKALEELLKSTKKQIETLDQIQGNETELFVGIKCGQKVRTKGSKLAYELKLFDQRTITVEFDNKLETVLKEIESFGTISDTSNRKRTCIASLFGEYNCKTNDDMLMCLVFDSCVLGDGHVLITDYNNQKLKRLDSTYKVTDYCNIDRPFGVCKTGSNVVAVSSWDRGKVFVVTTGKPMVVNGSFSVGEQCRGIAYNKGELFVACGIQGNGSYSVKVYNLLGIHLRTLPYKFSAIMHLSIDHKSSNLFVADNVIGLMKLDRQGENASEIPVPNLGYVCGVTDTSRYLFICYKDSNSVIRFDKDEKMIEEVLTATDGIISPASVTFANSQERLIITFWPSDTIKVFNLS